MSTSASVIIREDDRLPIVLYRPLDGGIAEYSEKYGRVAGLGMDLCNLVSRCSQKKLPASAETAANEILLLADGPCRVTDCIHEDIEMLYTLEIKADPKTSLKLCSLNGYAVELWNFARDPLAPVWKPLAWLGSKVPSTYYTHRYYIREMGSIVKKALSAARTPGA